MITSSLLNFSRHIDYFSEFLFFTTRTPSKCIRVCLKMEIGFFLRFLKNLRPQVELLIVFAHADKKAFSCPEPLDLICNRPVTKKRRTLGTRMTKRLKTLLYFIGACAFTVLVSNTVT